MIWTLTIFVLYTVFVLASTVWEWVSVQIEIQQLQFYKFNFVSSIWINNIVLEWDKVKIK